MPECPCAFRLGNSRKGTSDAFASMSDSGRVLIPEESTEAGGLGTNGRRPLAGARRLSFLGPSLMITNWQLDRRIVTLFSHSPAAEPDTLEDRASVVLEAYFVRVAQAWIFAGAAPSCVPPILKASFENYHYPVHEFRSSGH